MIIVPSNVVSPAANDPFFSNTVLLLKTVGVGGATNNAFRDDSPNNFVPTRVGDVTQGSFSPFSETVGDPVPVVGGSVFFDGAGDYLSLAANPALQFGASDFCIEAWINISATAANDGVIVEMRGTGGTSNGLVFNTRRATGGYVLNCYIDGAANVGSTVLAYGVWHHVALTRSGSTMRLFANGLVNGTFTKANNLTDNAVVTVGQSLIYGDSNITGSISNLRLVKGSAVYSSAFTPPTAPLTAISGTSLLTCQSDTTITDASSNAFAITRNGDARPGSLSPFGYGSVYFDGNGDYLTVANGTALQMGTGNFTVEFWWNPTVLSGFYVTPFDKGYTSAGGLLLQSNGADRLVAYLGGSAIVTSTVAIPTFSWSHIALVRNGTTVTMYVNGAAAGSGTSSADLNSTAALAVGVRASDAAYPITGSVSNLRVVKGNPVYTSAFTPPTAPLTAITGTSLLTAQDRGAIVDASTNNFAITRNGDVRPTSETPFTPRDSGKGWSAYFDGSGDWLYAPSNAAFGAGTGPYTVEMWIFPHSWSSNYVPILRNGGTTNGISFSKGYQANTLIVNNVGVGDMVTSNVLPEVGKWSHVVAVRSGTTLSIFVNGVRTGTATSSVNHPASDLYIGGFSDAVNSPFHGHISNVRYVKAAVYDPTLTTLAVPTEPLTSIANTSVLTCQDNRFIDRSSNNFALTRTGDVAVSRFSPFPVANTVTTNLSSTGSVTFDGNGDYLTVPSNAAIQFGTGDFCVEFWWNGQPTGSYTQNIGTLVSGTEEGTWRIGTRFNNSNTIYFARGTGSGFNEPQYSKNVNDGAWHHIACVRSSGIISMYVDGQKLTPSAGSENIAGTCSSSNQLFICYNGRDNAYSTGNMSNVRVVKGSPVYTSNFTPPTAPLTAITGTSLLTCQSAETVTDASTNNFTITRVGDAKASEVSPFKRSSSAFGGSAYFDGSGDYLALPSNAGYDFSAGDFTVEAWVMPATDPGWGQDWFIASASGSGGFFFGQDLVTTGQGIGYGRAGVAWDYRSGVSAPLRTWSHVAVSRSGGNIRLFVNGVQAGTTQVSSQAYNIGATSLNIGSQGAGYYFKGHMTGVRIVKGSAVYTANFTPPSAPVGAINGTSLLLNFDNAGITDATAGSVSRTVGDAKTSTAVTLFGGSTMYFDGNGDYLYDAGLSGQYAFGLSPFTIEFHMYALNVTSRQGLYSNNTSAGGTGPIFAIYGFGTTARLGVGNAQFADTVQTADNAFSINTWHHVALVREGTGTNQSKIYVDGILKATGTLSDNFNVARPINIGGTVHYGENFNGYLRDVRITRAARYTGNFNPPTAELPVK